MEFKAGDKIECIDPSGMSLTYGKEYTVLEMDGGDPVIVNDNENKQWYLRSRFKLKTSNMELKITEGEKSS